MFIVVHEGGDSQGERRPEQEGAKPATVVVPFGGQKSSSGGEETIVDQTGTPPEHAIWNREYWVNRVIS